MVCLSGVYGTYLGMHSKGSCTHSVHESVCLATLPKLLIFQFKHEVMREIGVQ
jgi:hypothetical protein